MSEQSHSAALHFRGSVRAGTGLIFVAVLMVLFSAMRVMGTLGPSRLNWLLPAGFVLMAFTPWFLLEKRGRKQIGLAPGLKSAMSLKALLLGAVAAAVVFGLGLLLFGYGPGNWFVTIAGNYRGRVDTEGFSLLQLHLVFTVPALIFSPIGEEIFFRGLLQRILEDHLSRRASTITECGIFGLVHLCHHGIGYRAGKISLLPVSGVLWVVLMFLVALLFVWIRKRWGSLYPAIAAHASFNLVMNAFIFSFLWEHI